MAHAKRGIVCYTAERYITNMYSIIIKYGDSGRWRSSRLSAYGRNDNYCRFPRELSRAAGTFFGVNAHSILRAFGQSRHLCPPLPVLHSAVVRRNAVWAFSRCQFLPLWYLYKFNGKLVNFFFFKIFDFFVLFFSFFWVDKQGSCSSRRRQGKWERRKRNIL